MLELHRNGNFFNLNKLTTSAAIAELLNFAFTYLEAGYRVNEHSTPYRIEHLMLQPQQMAIRTTNLNTN